MLVGPGERIAVDGTIRAGRSTVDQSALTGESLPIDRGPGDPVFTGTINQFGAIEVAAEKVGDETTFGQVLRLVAQARRKRAKLEKTADRLAPILPARGGAGGDRHAGRRLPAGLARRLVADGGRAGRRLPVRAGAGDPGRDARQHGLAGAARRPDQGGHGTREPWPRATRLPSTRRARSPEAGRRSPAWCPSPVMTKGRLIALAAAAESSSRHPLAAAVVEEARRRSLTIPSAAEAVMLPAPASRRGWTSPAERPRSCWSATAGCWPSGASSPMPRSRSCWAAATRRGETALLVAVDGAIAGVIGVHDPVRPEAHDVIHDLRHLKVREVAVLTGDREPAARAAAKKIHADTVAAELLPADKARWIEDRQGAGRKVAMVGDGINDAPALARGRRRHRDRRRRGRPGRGGRRDHPAGRPAPRPAGPGRAVAQHRGDHPAEHHRLRLRLQRRGDAVGDVRHARADRGGDAPPGRLAAGPAQLDAASGPRRAGPSWPPMRAVRRLGERIHRARRPGRPGVGLVVDLGPSPGRGDRGVRRRCVGLRHQRLDGDRAGRGRAAPSFRSVRGPARAGLHLALAVPDRAGDGRRARSGARAADRLPPRRARRAWTDESWSSATAGPRRPDRG